MPPNDLEARNCFKKVIIIVIFESEFEAVCILVMFVDDSLVPIYCFPIPDERGEETQMSRIISSKWPQKECDAKRASN